MSRLFWFFNSFKYGNRNNIIITYVDYSCANYDSNRTKKTNKNFNTRNIYVKEG